MFIIRIALKICSYILFALTLGAAYSGHINPNIWGVPAILTLVLPYLFIATVVVGLAWLIYRRYFMAIFAAATIILSFPNAKEACPISFEKSSNASDQTFSLLTYNVSQLSDYETNEEPSTKILSYLIHSGADIICCQELYNISNIDKNNKLAQQQIDSLKKIYPYIINGNTKDQTLLSKYPAIKMPQINSTQDIYSIYKLKINQHILNLISVHLASYNLTNDERNVVDDINSLSSAKASVRELKGNIKIKLADAFVRRSKDAEELRQDIDSIKGNLIVCGDFNDVPASWAYRTVKGDDMDDAYAQTGFGPLITYNAKHFYFHIDQVLYRGDFKALKVTKGKLKSSDHYPLLVKFKFD